MPSPCSVLSRSLARSLSHTHTQNIHNTHNTHTHTHQNRHTLNTETYACITIRAHTSHATPCSFVSGTWSSNNVALQNKSLFIISTSGWPVGKRCSMEPCLMTSYWDPASKSSPLRHFSPPTCDLLHARSSATQLQTKANLIFFYFFIARRRKACGVTGSILYPLT